VPPAVCHSGEKRGGKYPHRSSRPWIARACASSGENSRALLCAGACGKASTVRPSGRGATTRRAKWFLGRPLRWVLRSGDSVGPGAGLRPGPRGYTPGLTSLAADRLAPSGPADRRRGPWAPAPFAPAALAPVITRRMPCKAPVAILDTSRRPLRRPATSLATLLGTAAVRPRRFLAPPFDATPCAPSSSADCRGAGRPAPGGSGTPLAFPIRRGRSSGDAGRTRRRRPRKGQRSRRIRSVKLV